MNYLQRALVWALLLTFLSALCSSQTGTASLHGTISDPEGAVIPGAAATLSNPATGFSRTTKTDDNGFYQFLQVPPGTYTLSISKTGFVMRIRSSTLGLRPNSAASPILIRLTRSIRTGSITRRPRRPESTGCVPEEWGNGAGTLPGRTCFDHFG